MKISNQVQLITYANSMGGSLQALQEVLEGELAGLFGGVHILPPFISSGDRGFAPIDYHVIDPAFGSWEDIKAISAKHPVMLDLMVNHVSRRSPMFTDFLQKGSSSAYADFFLTPDKVWGDTPPTPEELQKIVLRRARPWSEYEMADGSTISAWTTFGSTDPSEQIDLDVNSTQVRDYFENLFAFFAEHGVALIRLDAVGYVIKQRGSSCFMVEPQISQFLKWMQQTASSKQVMILNEVHAAHTVTNSLAAQGHLGYDFLMPFTVLYTLLARDSRLLCEVLRDRPTNQIVTLDCHDGVPVQPDMNGWISADQAWLVVNKCAECGARFSKMHTSEMHNDDYPDVHQICGSYYSLLGEDDNSYLAARAIQLFVPGIPQLYYVGLFAGQNDIAQMAAEDDDRGLNRHNYTKEEMTSALARDVVRRLRLLILLRNTHPAFDGSFSTVGSTPTRICFDWQHGVHSCGLAIDLGCMETTVRYTAADGLLQDQVI